MTTLLWFSRDLRLDDNPALGAAMARGEPIVPVFILDDADAGAWAAGGAAHWWLHGSLAALDGSLRHRGAPLILRRGPAEGVIHQLLEQTGADAVYWNRRYELWAIARNAAIKTALRGRGIEARSFNAALLREPWAATKQDGTPYRVFTPFWRALQAAGVAEPAVAAPGHIPAPGVLPESEPLASWGLQPTAPDWAGGMRAMWTPGEAGAQARLDEFAEASAFSYHDRRNTPGVDGTSRLSPHLHFGEIGPRQIWRTITARSSAQSGAETGGQMPPGVATYLSEIAWREFSYHLLYYFPSLPEAPLRADFASFPWMEDSAGLSAWQRGQTGYPIIDAGMRELWHTGWMHNRVRMIVASFLIKDLLIDWRVGERWFWDTLVDADLASNAASWQWVAGCGADASPYFRVFNPALQSAKFDPEGGYIRRWVPEIGRLPNRLLHTPWQASPMELADAGIRLGQTYPAPIVDHDAARKRALAALGQIRSP